MLLSVIRLLYLNQEADFDAPGKIHVDFPVAAVDRILFGMADHLSDFPDPLLSRGIQSHRFAAQDIVQSPRGRQKRSMRWILLPQKIPGLP